MDSLTRFGSGDQLYTFIPAHQISLRDNFRDVVPRTTRLPGVDGGFDEFGSLPAPAEIGNVQVVFWLHGETEPQINMLKRQVGAMRSFGVKRLYKQPVDGGADELYVDARVNSADYSEAARDMAHKRLRVTVNFQVASPGWRAPGTESALWGDGTIWGAGTIWGGDAAPVTVVGINNSFSITPGGNANTYPRILVTIPTAKSATDVRIQRMSGGEVADEVRYNAALAAGDSLEINCRALSVKLNGSNAYGTAFSFQNAAWIKLEGGIANTIRVLMDNAADEARVTFKYYEVYV